MEQDKDAAEKTVENQNRRSGRKRKSANYEGEREIDKRYGS